MTGPSASPPNAAADDRVATTREYLAALERFATGEELARFFTPDVLFEELPNRLNPAGQRRDLAAARASAERGRQILREQRYVVRKVVASRDTVALEVEWTGVLAVPVGSLPAGAEMRAHSAMFLEFREGRISRQRNYDCFEPW